MTALAEPKLRRPILIWFAAGHCANDWAPATIWLLAPAIGEAMDLTAAQIGLLITLQAAGAAMAYFPAGLLADRFANRGILLAATFWWVAIGFFVASYAPEFWSLALLLAIAGMGDAAWHPIATGALTQGMPGRRAHVLGLHAAGGTLAEVLAPLSIGFLLGWFDWRVSLQISILPAVTLGIVFFVIRNRIPRSPVAAIQRADLADMWRIWCTAAGLRMIARIAFYNMAFIAILSMSPLFLQRTHGFTPAETGIVFAVMLLVGAATQPYVGLASDIFGRRVVIFIGNVLGTAGALGAALSGNIILIIAALIVAAAALTGIRSAILAASVDFTRQREATTLGLAFALMDGIGALGGVLAGYAASQDLTYAFFVAAALSVLSIIFGLTLTRREIRPGTDTP